MLALLGFIGAVQGAAQMPFKHSKGLMPMDAGKALSM